MSAAAWGLPAMASNPASPEVSFNELADLLGAGAPPPVLASASLTAPPADPPELALYAVPAGASGAWAGQGGKVARRRFTAWQFFTPPAFVRAWVADEGREAVFTPAHGWLRGAAVGAFGGAIGWAVAEAELGPLSGASATAAALIPEGAIVHAVASRTVEAITGAASYRVGDGVNVDRFGSGLGVAAGSTNRGVIGPAAYYAPTAVVVEAQGGAFTGGRVRLSVLFAAVTIPGAA